MSPENKEKLLTGVILILVVAIILVVINKMVETKNIEKETVEVDKVELVGDKKTDKGKEKNKTPGEGKAPIITRVETPDFSREKEEKEIEVLEWDNNPKNIGEGEVVKDETPRYELGEIITDLGVVDLESYFPIEGEDREKPIDEFDMRFDINFTEPGGGTLTRHNIETKETIILLWSAFYPESIEALKVWEKVYKKEKDNYNFIFLNRGFGYKEDVAGVEELFEEEEIELPYHIDKAMLFQSSRYDSAGYPATYYLTRDLDLHKVVNKIETQREIEENLKGIPDRIPQRIEQERGKYEDAQREQDEKDQEIIRKEREALEAAEEIERQRLELERQKQEAEKSKKESAKPITPRPITPTPRPVTPTPRPITPPLRPITPMPRPITPTLPERPAGI